MVRFRVIDLLELLVTLIVMASLVLAASMLEQERDWHRRRRLVECQP